jgi:hypothetical protein
MMIPSAARKFRGLIDCLSEIEAESCAEIFDLAPFFQGHPANERGAHGVHERIAPDTLAAASFSFSWFHFLATLGISRPLPRNLGSAAAESQISNLR